MSQPSINLGAFGGGREQDLARILVKMEPSYDLLMALAHELDVTRPEATRRWQQLLYYLVTLFYMRYVIDRIDYTEKFTQLPSTFAPMWKLFCDASSEGVRLFEGNYFPGWNWQWRESGEYEPCERIDAEFVAIVVDVAEDLLGIPVDRELWQL